MEHQSSAVDRSKTIVVVRRIDVVVAMLIIALMIACYHWIVAHRQLQYERQVNAELVKTKAELAEALAIQRINLNRRIGMVEQIVVDKKFVDNWAGFIQEVGQYSNEKKGNARHSKALKKGKSAKGSGGRSATYAKTTYLK